MLAGVGDERAGDGEGFAAAVAHVGLLARVPPHVVRQRAGLGKALPAAVTHVRLLPAVLPATTTAQPRQQLPATREGLREGSVPAAPAAVLWRNKQVTTEFGVSLQVLQRETHGLVRLGLAHL